MGVGVCDDQIRAAPSLGENFERFDVAHVESGGDGARRIQQWARPVVPIAAARVDDQHIGPEPAPHPSKRPARRDSRHRPRLVSKSRPAPDTTLRTEKAGHHRHVVTRPGEAHRELVGAGLDATHPKVLLAREENPHLASSAPDEFVKDAEQAFDLVARVVATARVFRGRRAKNAAPIGVRDQ
jgi:hypothetical protein